MVRVSDRICKKQKSNDRLFSSQSIKAKLAHDLVFSLLPPEVGEHLYDMCSIIGLELFRGLIFYGSRNPQTSSF